MNPSAWQLVLPASLLYALVIIHRHHAWLQHEHGEGYRKLASGASILALTSVLQLASDCGLVSRLPFLNDPLFFSLVLWIAIITGVVFLAAGAAMYLPLAREYRLQNRTIINRLELIKHIEQLVAVETRPEAILTAAVNHIVAAYAFQSGAAYTYGSESRRLKHVSTHGRSPIESATLESIEVDVQKLYHDPDSFPKTVTSAESEDTVLPATVILPVSVNRHLSAVLFFWGEEDLGDDHAARLNLKLTTEIISRSIEAADNRRRAISDGRFCKLATILSQSIGRNRSVQQIMTVAAQSINLAVKSDSIVLLLPGRNGKWRRLTVGSNGAFLHEKRIMTSAMPPFIVSAIDDPTPRCANDLPSELGGVSEPASTNRSAIILPVVKPEGVVGVLVIYLSEGIAISEDLPGLLMPSASVLGEIRWLLQSYDTRDTAQRRQQLVRAFLRDSYRRVATQEIFTDASRVLSYGIDHDVIRISTIDRTRRFLNSRALTDRNSNGNVAPERASLILDLLPVHRLLLDGRKTVVIDKAHGVDAIGDQETAHMFGRNLTSMLLAPIYYEGRVVGIISVGKEAAKGDDCFTEFDTCFVELVASAMSLSIRQVKLDRWARRGESVEKSQLQLRSRVKSSLSGIVGSMELIRERSTDAGDSMGKYYEIIDRSVQRLADSVSRQHD